MKLPQQFGQNVLLLFTIGFTIPVSVFISFIAAAEILVPHLPDNLPSFLPSQILLPPFLLSPPSSLPASDPVGHPCARTPYRERVVVPAWT